MVNATPEQIRRLQEGESFASVFRLGSTQSLTETVKPLTEALSMPSNIAGIGIGGLIIGGIILFLLLRKGK